MPGPGGAGLFGMPGPTDWPVSGMPSGSAPKADSGQSIGSGQRAGGAAEPVDRMAVMRIDTSTPGMTAPSVAT
jgi:hypothetical protein